jgi:hypothetical protein
MHVRDGERGNAGVSLPASGWQAADAGWPDGTRADGQSPRGTVSGGRRAKLPPALSPPVGRRFAHRGPAPSLRICREELLPWALLNIVVAWILLLSPCAVSLTLKQPQNPSSSRILLGRHRGCQLVVPFQGVRLVSSADSVFGCGGGAASGACGACIGARGAAQDTAIARAYSTLSRTAAQPAPLLLRSLRSPGLACTAVPWTLFY